MRRRELRSCRPWAAARAQRVAPTAAFVAALIGAPSQLSARPCTPGEGAPEGSLPRRLSSCVEADAIVPFARGPFMVVPPADTASAGSLAFGVISSLVTAPIALRVPSADPTGTDLAIVARALSLTFAFAYGVTDRFELTASAPAVIYQEGAGLDSLATGVEPLPRSAMRDLRFGFGFALLRPDGHRLGTAASARVEFSAPTGDRDGFSSSGSAAMLPSFSISHDFRRLKATASLSAVLRRVERFANARVGSGVGVSAGALVSFFDEPLFSAGAEIFGRAHIVSQEGAAAPPVPLEWAALARVEPPFVRGFEAGLSFGTSLPTGSVAAITAPAWRAMLALRYAPAAGDADNDGIADADDACPRAPEDRDGYRDTDGCPDRDNDGDRIPDERDRCPDVPETVDGYRDDDGCPDGDDDNDGIPDERDRCRHEAEDRDGIADADGCPEVDADGDGVPDERDLCPTSAEDRDGYKDGDGCPDPDDDLDGVPDKDDACKAAPEDRDGFEDADGCPDLDNDDDGVADADDRCKNEPETLDGRDDDDGCPEELATSRVTLRGSAIVFDKPPRFAPSSARLGRDEAAAVVLAAKRVRVLVRTGHVIIVEAWPDRPNDASVAATNLAARRADAVRAALIGAGLPKPSVVAAAGDSGARGAPPAGFEITLQKQQP